MDSPRAQPLEPSETDTAGLFADPPDFYPPSPPPTTTASFTTSAGDELTLQLVGHSPLEAHTLWNGARVVSQYLEADPGARVEGRTFLELGAGAGLPSLVAARLGAGRVVVTDYPDAELIEVLWRNIEAWCPRTAGRGDGKADGPSADASPDPAAGRNIVAHGFVWGYDPAPLLTHVSTTTPSSSSPGFDTLILADLLFRHTEHHSMVKTIRDTLRRTRSSVALVFFTSYRPWLRAKDLAFFDKCREAGFEVELLLEKRMDRPLFENDPGDEEVLKTVSGYAVRWPASACDEG